jgi:hypothetical protein
MLSYHRKLGRWDDTELELGMPRTTGGERLRWAGFATTTGDEGILE